MKMYTVKEVSELLSIDQETVRRWIRNGKLSATIDSKKGGNKISQDALNKFLQSAPKYATKLTESISSPMGLSFVIGGLLGGLIAAVLCDSKPKKLSDKDVEKFLKDKITSCERSIQDKKLKIKELEEEITKNQKELEKYSIALNRLDFKVVAEQINNDIQKGIENR